MNLRELISYTEVVAVGGNLNKEVMAISNDSKEVLSNAVFVAVSGYKTDGHHFIVDALKGGAVAVIIENSAFQSDTYTWIQVKSSRKALGDLSNIIYGQPSQSLNIIGVTGTNGKTTTTNLIARILEDNGHIVGLIGTIHNRIGKEIIPVRHTTPEAPELQKYFKVCLEKNADYGVMEVSSHALELHRIRGTEVDVGVFTNLTQEHLDFHRDMEGYLTSKGKLFSSLGCNAKKKRRKFAILNIDDQYEKELEDMTSVPIITYGIINEADVKANDVKSSSQGVEYTLKYTNQEIPVKLKLRGRFNVYNSLAAIAVGLVEGISVENIISTLEKITGIPGRFESVNKGNEYVVIVDYCHTPDSLEKCLKTAREFVQGQLITVFGCGGDRDRSKRPIMGEVAGRLSDYCIVTSDNPRSENPEAIINDIIPGLEKGAGSNSYLRNSERREAIFKAIEKANPQDVVIIAGKGHEDYQIIGTQTLHFDDREVAKEALVKTGKWKE
ncbi:MAG: UDP-N-acetylmuramoyl-L-alanyl-D-glutamate--2,6-diaminopimelate ligase [Clostridia bacterium]|nr:UDP-N-acetylmuramoyl-L-alanyl-D-glutamate--2,6-diaminopimelate ligase [Clostridia bacterium]